MWLLTAFVNAAFIALKEQWIPWKPKYSNLFSSQKLTYSLSSALLPIRDLGKLPKKNLFAGEV